MTTAITEEEIGQLQHNLTEADFGRTEFLEIVHVERPNIIYRCGRKHFFFLACLAVTTRECSDSDFANGHLLLPWLPSAVEN